ncbi:hypothetical protein F4703DRAFT_1841092 [Phycomyces blakesleeanus]
MVKSINCCVVRTNRLCFVLFHWYFILLLAIRRILPFILECLDVSFFVSLLWSLNRRILFRRSTDCVLRHSRTALDISNEKYASGLDHMR